MKRNFHYKNYVPIQRARVHSRGRSMVTCHLTIQLFPAKSPRAGDIVKTATSESIAVHCYLRILTAFAREQSVGH